MDKPKVVPASEYSSLNTGENVIVCQYRSKGDDGTNGWIAARIISDKAGWETFGAGRLYYWIDGSLAASIPDFMDKMMSRYPEDATWILFHPELFEGRYHG